MPNAANYKDKATYLPFLSGYKYMNPWLKIFTIFLKVLIKVNIRECPSFFYDALFWQFPQE
jgi:hypothetical protein